MKICDRCGNRLPHPLAQTTFPTYNITGNWIDCAITIDLCPKCESDFTEWLKELKENTNESSNERTGEQSR